MWEGSFYTVTEDYYNKQSISLKDVASYSDEKPLIIYAETDHSVAQLKEIARLNDQKIPPYAQVHLYQSVRNNMKKMLPHQLLVDLESASLKREVPLAKQHAFIGKAKYRSLLVYLDSKANLVEIVKTP